MTTAAEAPLSGPLLFAREWQLRYTPDDGDLVGKFYVPALRSAVKYDRFASRYGAGRGDKRRGTSFSPSPARSRTSV